MANSKIRGITIEIGGDTTKLDKALGSVDKKVKGTQVELRDCLLYTSDAADE